MATYSIISETAGSPYKTIEVSFGEHVFVQDVLVAGTAKAIAKRLQDYADEYEASYVSPLADPAELPSPTP
jgi:hypothetical protein